MVKCSVLKRMDMFADPVRLRTTRANSSKPTLNYGSWTGVIMTLSGMIMLITYLCYLIFRMYYHEDDFHSSLTLVNDFKDHKTNHFKLSEFPFLLSLEVDHGYLIYSSAFDF